MSDIGLALKISIHALREEGDIKTGIRGTALLYFYPRPPRGGRLLGLWRSLSLHTHFYPRPPRGGRQRGPADWGRLVSISIHALREEGDAS